MDSAVFSNHWTVFSSGLNQPPAKKRNRPDVVKTTHRTDPLSSSDIPLPPRKNEAGLLRPQPRRRDFHQPSVAVFTARPDLRARVALALRTEFELPLPCAFKDFAIHLLPNPAPIAFVVEFDPAGLAHRDAGRHPVYFKRTETGLLDYFRKIPIWSLDYRFHGLRISRPRRRLASSLFVTLSAMGSHFSFVFSNMAMFAR